jgi:hypothetical protein
VRCHSPCTWADQAEAKETRNTHFCEQYKKSQIKKQGRIKYKKHKWKGNEKEIKKHGKKTREANIHPEKETE